MSEYFSCNNAEELFNEEDNSNKNIMNIIIQYIDIIYEKIYNNNKDVSQLVINYQNKTDEQLIDYFYNLEINSENFFNTCHDLYLLMKDCIYVDKSLNKLFNFNEEKFINQTFENKDLEKQYNTITLFIRNSIKNEPVEGSDILNNWRNNILNHYFPDEVVINYNFFKTYFKQYTENIENILDINKNVEYKILSLIALTNILINKNADEYYKYELFVYLSKLFEDIQKNKIKIISCNSNIFINQKSNLNDQLIEDLKVSIQIFKDKILFDSIKLSQNYPQFVFFTRYDNLFNNTIKPYRSQIQLVVNIILSNIKQNNIEKNNIEASFDINGTLILLKTITGEGKTTMAIPLAYLAKKLRNHPGTRFDSKNLEILYCCNNRLKSNMVQVVNNAKSINLPFAVACIDDNCMLSTKILSKNITSGDFKDQRLLLIADIESTIKLLEEANTKNKSIGILNSDNKIEIGKEFILFFDEPTSFLDSDNSKLTDDLCKLYKLMPANTILASATLPENNDLLLKFESYYLTRYKNRDYSLIVSENSQIGSEIYDFSGNIYLPNKNITDMTEYNNIIKNIKSNLFLKKLYTLFTTSLLWENINALKIKNKIGEIDDIDNFKEKYSNPSELNQKNIQNTALQYLSKITQNNLTDFNRIEYNSFSVDLYKLRELKNNFKSQTLIITKDPINFIEKYVNTEINSLLLNINNKFNTNFLNINDFINNIRNYDIRDLIIQNCESHNNNIYDPRTINWNVLNNEIKTSKNEIKIKALLLGIGIYDPYNETSYLKDIIKLGTHGVLPYIVSNTDIAYGTNFKIEYIIIDNTCFNPNDKPHSINTLFQLIARAGRRGISWKASIYCDSMVINMINNFCNRTNNNLIIEDEKFNEIINKLNIEYGVKLIDISKREKLTLPQLLNASDFSNTTKLEKTLNFLQIGGKYINYNFINPTLPKKSIKKQYYITKNL